MTRVTLEGVWSILLLGDLCVNCAWAFMTIPKPHRQGVLLTILFESLLPLVAVWGFFLIDLTSSSSNSVGEGDPGQPMNPILFIFSLAVITLISLLFGVGIHLGIKRELIRRGQSN